MSMHKFTYLKAQDAAEAVAEIKNAEKFIAGGTNLLDLMKENVMKPERLINVSKLPFNSIEENEEGGIRLGAMMTNAATAWHPLVEERYPLLLKAILAGASAQLRNMATNGGNLLQRTRCYYFYDTATPCNKREPGSGCSAIKGYNRIHAILGTSDQCIATHPSDMCVALAALDATVNVTGKNGERKIPFQDFHRLPGDTPETDTNLQPDELITSIDLPKTNFAENFMYLKLRDRASYAFALVSVAAGLELDGNIIKDARLALGGVAHKPWRVKEAEEQMKNQPAIRSTFEAAAEIILKGAQGFGNNNFKIELAKRAVVRACEQAKNKEGKK